MGTPDTQDTSLQGRVVLVTGGVRGLGREMALALLAAGARVAATGSTASPAADALADEAAALGAADRLWTATADVTRPEACATLVADVVSRFGRLDVLVNNAGRGMRLVSERFNTEPTRFWETDPQAWHSIVATNLDGAFYMARAAVPGMVARGFGKVVNISTSDQTMVRRGYAPYGPSKAGLEAASRIWAADLAGTGVDVNVFLPGGAADTDLLPPGVDRKGADGQLLPASVMRRGILWLCSDASNGVTGRRYIARLWPTQPGGEDTAAPPSMLFPG
ncbi:SDR family NAD(P)-dependent oxidoreductase [uncultured Xylophilus sp.]|uniref:SDR family NAD(P)-dependent oxidoreductase n=1 Tax=uncultured Xylophilus sp. TaxID=296832 RepID=UPI0025F7CCAA|nr:SDR family NAD(P)-dependent oxidoreductase [uncultured Xylophilus sp.]